MKYQKDKEYCPWLTWRRTITWNFWVFCKWRNERDDHRKNKLMWKRFKHRTKNALFQLILSSLSTFNAIFILSSYYSLPRTRMFLRNEEGTWQHIDSNHWKELSLKQSRSIYILLVISAFMQIPNFQKFKSFTFTFNQ